MRRTVLRKSVGAYSAGTYVEEVEPGTYRVVGTGDIIEVDEADITLLKERDRV